MIVLEFMQRLWLRCDMWACKFSRLWEGCWWLGLVGSGQKFHLLFLKHSSLRTLGSWFHLNVKCHNCRNHVQCTTGGGAVQPHWLASS